MDRSFEDPIEPVDVTVAATPHQPENARDTMLPELWHQQWMKEKKHLGLGTLLLQRGGQGCPIPTAER